MILDLNGITIPDWVKWLAQDADGHWWGYEVQPQEFSQGWYENELGRRICLKKSSQNPKWANTLIKLADLLQ